MREYYIHDGQLEKGPFDFEQLKKQPIGRQTPVWYEGLENWAMAGNVDELKGLIGKITPPPLPKLFEKNPALRHKVLDSFTTAQEIVPQPKKNP